MKTLLSGGLRLPSELALGLGLIAIVAVLLVPLPPFLLDAGIALSITVSFLILIVCLLIKSPLQLSSFPTILLITTMLRLSLNVASTRLILSGGQEGTAAAGGIIQAFGAFMTFGNVVIGFIVFIILIIVNFMVITKGSGRIAEVAARFSLDAMPGKQMAIDAELAAGAIDETEARRRREQLENESNFFGSMDGAAKFVRGDATAGLLITAINLIGGLAIGTMQQGLGAAEAARTYSLLTIGDGLVSQVPSLLVSVAAGLLVAKAGVKGRADTVLVEQLGAYPNALKGTAVLVVLLGLIPGVPFLPFLGLAALCYWLSTLITPRDDEEREAAGGSKPAPAAGVAGAAPAEPPVTAALSMDAVRLELGYGLLSLIGEAPDANLTGQIKALRQQLAAELGFVMPSVRVQDNIELPSNTYVIKVKEIEVARGDLRPGMLLVMDPEGQDIAIPGEATREPTFGLAAAWVSTGLRDEAHFRGYTVVDAATVLTTHLAETVKDNLAEVLNVSQINKTLEGLDSDYRKIFEEIVPSKLSVTSFQRVLQALLAERISIRDMPAIIEAISDAASANLGTVATIERVRAHLARQISQACTGPKGYVPLIALSEKWETAFADNAIGDGEARQVAFAPSQIQSFAQELNQKFEKAAMAGEMAVLLCSPSIRPLVRSIVERVRSSTTVLSHLEIHPKAKIKTVDQL